MCLRRILRSLQRAVFTQRAGSRAQTLTSLEELIGKSVHISLMHLFYDGWLAAQCELYGHIARIDDSAIVVRLAGSQQECRLLRDVRIFSKGADADLYVSVGSVGVPYRNDLTRCLYQKLSGATLSDTSGKSPKSGKMSETERWLSGRKQRFAKPS